MSHGASKSKTKNVLVIPDLQVPYEDKRSLNAVEQVMGYESWDEIIQIGDFLDLDCISTFNEKRLRTIAKKTIQKDFDAGNAILDRWQKLAPKAKITILEGNHDERMLRYIDANPQLEGSIEVPRGLNLEKRGVRWVPSWSQGDIYQIGNAYFTHGQYVNEHHAKKHVIRFGVNIFYGHTHDVQQYSAVLLGEDKTIVGQSLGCLCRYDQSYLKGSPTNWQQAFASFHFFGDGFFTSNIVRIFKNRFYYNGRVYKGVA